MDGFIMVHGSPNDEDEYILGPGQALPLLRGPESQLVCFGHTHLQGGFMMDELPAVFNPSIFPPRPMG